MHQILELEADTYQRHSIHLKERDWAETNCYADVWIELLHALGHEPIAAMPFTLGIDFEGDQWTFFKFQISDLYDLYGIDVQELAVWKPLTTHIEEQIALGRPVLVELDSMFLPDTAGTAYQIAHVKTTVAVNRIDIKNKHLSYFHAQGYYTLQGEDFDNIFHLSEKPNGLLAPYVEIAKLSKSQQYNNKKLIEISIGLLAKQLAKLPLENPFLKFKEQLVIDLDWLTKQDIEMFHQYSFATLRQLGACFELSANYLDWLCDHGENQLDQAKQAFRSISETAKVYQFQLARAVSRGKLLDLSIIDSMAANWSTAMKSLKLKYLNE